jgi:methionine-rich copper-binding protein CopC
MPLASASAHAELESSTPAANAMLTTSPKQVVLVFGEKIQDVGDGIIVTSPNGARVDTGTTKVAGDTATQSLLPLTDTGAYTVRFRIVSADGHVVGSSYRFTYDSDPTAGAPNATPVAAQSTSSSSSGAASALIIGGAAVVAVIVVIVLRRRRSTPGRQAV